MSYSHRSADQGWRGPLAGNACFQAGVRSTELT
jgi:hypothetical protein